jgi:hypothetical protein
VPKYWQTEVISRFSSDSRIFIWLFAVILIKYFQMSFVCKQAVGYSLPQSAAVTCKLTKNPTFLLFLHCLVKK